MRFFCDSLPGEWSQSSLIELESRRPAGITRKRFCELMRLSRSTLYYKPQGESAENLSIMQELDTYSLEHPTAGVEMMTQMLRNKGYHVNVKRVRRLMRKMNLMAIYPNPKLSDGDKAEYIHPYLLRGLQIERPNQVWNTDISYVSMNGRFMYLYNYQQSV